MNYNWHKTLEQNKSYLLYCKDLLNKERGK